ncbi:hypothetical protein WALSEDRAFT_68940 [Wallemia mellicola CBS 633.66]|uniref:Uncharacterized protein n=1 Tax=Wallemia mellicola (strain ATCC MYA-4683 / CBS 633.66) TaxID=671144 RepID=I4YCJ4_WALMC|nr:hypothetical protein WALSEDRAFT_68940 [Wallemia mellicola CBS 633.66]EIM21686.1 hypothetical protein WALSEDRAFT_68940 [Wallemia mellicola CBS 633.66]|eukprot:XP_006958373.1 hypothetical protein WALSEDRAFT_68940 [Wallemia mellicola CBS 633.66]
MAIIALFFPPLPAYIQTILLLCRYLAFSVTFPIVFLMLLDASAYVVFRTLGIYARRVRVVDKAGKSVAVDMIPPLSSTSNTPPKQKGTLKASFLDGINNESLNRRSINQNCLKTLANNLKLNSNELTAHQAANVPLPADADKGLNHRRPLAAA